MRSSFVTPSTIAATSWPKSSSSCSWVSGGVLDRVVEQGGRDRDVVEAEVGEDPGDAERVGDVGLARPADLLRVGLERDVVGGLDAGGVGLPVALLVGLEQRGEGDVDLVAPPRQHRAADVLTRDDTDHLPAPGLHGDTCTAAIVARSRRGAGVLLALAGLLLARAGLDHRAAAPARARPVRAGRPAGADFAGGLRRLVLGSVVASSSSPTVAAMAERGVPCGADRAALGEGAVARLALLPPDEQWRGDEDRRVRTDDQTDEERQAELTQRERALEPDPHDRAGTRPATAPRTTCSATASAPG